MSKPFLLILTFVGFVVPNVFVAMESITSGNVMLWLDPAATMKAMFGSRINTVFSVDLLFAVMVFFYWTYHSFREYRVKNLALVWILTLLFGLAGAFPLSLYLIERSKERDQDMAGN
jgi:hypothetical protein